MVPAVAGALEYRKNRAEPATLAVLHAFTANQGDAWHYTRDALGHYFDRVLVRQKTSGPGPDTDQAPLELSRREVDGLANDLINPYLETARLLGRHTAELHVALADAEDNPAFTPEPFNPFYQRSVYQSLRNVTHQAFQNLSRRLKHLPDAVLPPAKILLDRKDEIMKRFQVLVGMKITALRIRCHGDYHLGQVLVTGKDFAVIDFEGEPSRSFQERRIKRSPLKDVAGMLRSFHYAAYSCLLERGAQGLDRPEDSSAMENWACFWYLWSSSAFLRSYLEAARPGNFLPVQDKELAVLLDIHMLEKAIYELDYELNNRPAWVLIPVKGITQILQSQPPAS